MLDYLRYLRYERRMSPNTERNYQRDIEALCRFLEREDLRGWDDIDYLWYPYEYRNVSRINSYLP